MVIIFSVFSENISRCSKKFSTCSWVICFWGSILFSIWGSILFSLCYIFILFKWAELVVLYSLKLHNSCIFIFWLNSVVRHAIISSGNWVVKEESIETRSLGRTFYCCHHTGRPDLSVKLLGKSCPPWKVRIFVFSVQITKKKKTNHIFYSYPISKFLENNPNLDHMPTANWNLRRRVWKLTSPGPDWVCFRLA